jgi:exopolysaccharide biosynthesis polyprenyl glycosylphosphotransferase
LSGSRAEAAQGTQDVGVLAHELARHAPLRYEADAYAVIPEGMPARASLRRDHTLAIALVMSDLVVSATVFLLAIVWFGQQPIDLAALSVAAFVPLAAKAGGLYDRDRHLLRKTTLDEVPKLFHAATLYVLAFWFVDSLLTTSRNMSPRDLAVTWVALFVLLVAGRFLVRAVTRAWLPPERCLVLGDAGTAWFLRDRIERLGGGHATIVGRVPLVPDRDNGVRVLGNFDSLGVVLAKHDIDRVIVAPGEQSFDRSMQGIRATKALGVKVTVFPRLFEALGSSVEFDNVAGVTLLGVREFGLPRSSYRLKRAMDVTAAGLGMLVLSPLLAVIALAIKLDSPGPVFHRQRRIGRDGLEFEMLKFRTMCADAEQRRREVEQLNETVGLFKLAEDPRVTRVGRLLRRASMDELPQLWNVVCGRMSLVGPRPLVPEEDEKVEGWERRRLHVPPGMTGPWQILGATRVPLSEMVKMDYLYGANWSLWGDVKTILRTVPHVLGRKGM